MKVVLCGLLCLALATVMAAADANVAGTWTGTFTTEQGEGNSAYMILKQTGTTVTGTAGPDESQQWPMSKIKLAANKVTAEVTSPDGGVYKVEMTFNGDHMTGTVVVTQGDQTMKGTLDMTRNK